MSIVRALPLIVSAAGSAAVSFTLFSGSRAEAREPTSAVSCLYESDWNGDYGVTGDGIQNRSGGPWGSARNIYCPVSMALRDSGQPIFVDGFDGNNEVEGQVKARICVTSWAGGGAFCEAPTPITTGTETGFFVGRSLDAANVNLLRRFDLAGHYPVLVISIPRNGILGNSRIAGIQTW